MKKLTERESRLHGTLCEVWRIVDGLAVVQDLVDNDGDGLTDRELTDLRAMVCPTLNFTSMAIGKLIEELDDERWKSISHHGNH